ncbi:MAG: hypothetical protein AAFN51_11805 [Pseudomonadota bacterium]
MLKILPPCIALIIIVLTASVFPVHATETKHTTLTLSQTCTHYVNRAKFKHRHPDQAFVVTLADACTAATASLRSENPREVNTATQFLIRLRVLRALIIEMNMKRAFGDRYTAWTRLGHDKRAVTEALPRVSGTGEYLIARQLGLLNAYHSWLETGPSLTLRR